MEARFDANVYIGDEDSTLIVATVSRAGEDEIQVSLTQPDWTDQPNIDVFLTDIDAGVLVGALAALLA